jgi:hypothetical protein
MSLATSTHGTLYHLLRSIMIASATQHARLIDRVTFADDEPALDRGGELTRVPLSTPSLASGMFVAAAPFEEDAERWDGLS